MVKEFGIPLDAAAIEYAEARKILGGHPLTEAARFFMRHHGRGLEGKPLADAVEAFKAEKRAEGRSELYLEDLRYRLDDFAKAFNVEVRQLTPSDVRDFLNELKFSARSYNNHRRALQTFFNFCQSRGWLSREADLLEGIGKRKEAPADIEIFTAAELRRILHAATPKAATCIALQAFAGVRSEELLRLTWTDLERRKGFIEITAGKAKTAQRRLIPISPNLVQWLADAPRSRKGLAAFKAVSLRGYARCNGQGEGGLEGQRTSAFVYHLPAGSDQGRGGSGARSGQFADDDLPPLPGIGHRRGGGGLVRHPSGQRCSEHRSYDGVNKSKADSYLQKLKERRLDPIGDPLICGIREPYPFSSGFSTGEVLEKALAWHQEFAARVRKYQEEPDMPLQERTEAANLLVNLATEATMTVKALSITFPDVFKAVASRKASFPINIPALREDRDEIIHWLTETLQLGSEHELKLRGRKTFPAERSLISCFFTT